MPSTPKPADRDPLLLTFRRRRRLAVGLIQLIYVIAGAVVGLVIPRIHLGHQANSQDVVTLLAGLSAGLLTAASVIYALLFLVVQFAANSQSPRLNLFRDHPLVWHTLGLAVGTLVYLVTCAIVCSDRATTTVLVPTSAIVLALLLLAFAAMVQMAAFRSVQLSPVLSTITSRTRTIIDRLYTAPFTGSSPAPIAVPSRIVEVTSPSPGRVLRQINLPRLIELSRRADTVIRLHVMPGDYVLEGSAVLEVWEAAETVDPAAVLECLEMGIDRTHVQDPLLGFRLLVDIAMRAMSRINDPATAVQTMDYIESLLRTLVTRDLAIGVVTDESGSLRVLFEPPGWETFLAAGADEIAGADMHPMVRQRLELLLKRLLDIAPAERRPPIQKRLAALELVPPSLEVRS